MHFAQGATIGVKLGGRRVPRNTPVISWTAATAPDATVKFIRADEGRNYSLFFNFRAHIDKQTTIII